MIPRKFRIPKRNFPSVLKGKNRASEYFRVIKTPSYDQYHHIAVIVPKKVVSTAVKRNSIQRKLYRILLPYIKPKQQSGNEKGKKYCTIIFIKKDISSRTLSETENELLSIV